MADSERKYWIVEFDDGIQVIPLNWFSDPNKTKAYWPNLKNFKAYDQAVEKMQEVNYDNWTEVSVKNVLGSSDLFQKAKSKLREAERVTDINSGQETDYLKKRRRVRAAKIYDSQNTPPSACKVSRLDKFPTQPTKRLHQHISNEYSQSQPSRPVVQKQSMLSASNILSNSIRTTKTSESIETSKSQLGERSDVPSNKKSSPRNNDCTRSMHIERKDMSGSDETLFESQLDMFESQNRIESQNVIESQDIMGSEVSIERDRGVIDRQDIINNQPINESPITLINQPHCEPSQRIQKRSVLKTLQKYKKNSEPLPTVTENDSETCPPECTHCILHSKSNFAPQNVINETNPFQKFVVRSLIEMKHKLNMLLQNDNEIFNRLATSEKQAGSNCHISEEAKDRIKDIILHFPLKNRTELNSLEKTLTDKDNFSLMVSELKKIGGHEIKAAVYNLMRRIFSNDVAQQFSWFGKKKKSVFSELKICRVILDSVQCHYPNATDSAIADPIKDWVRHAPERKKKEVREDSMGTSDDSEQ